MITTYKIVTGAAVGANGSATVTGTSPQVITGRVLAVAVTRTGGTHPATTDTTVRGAASAVGAKVPIVALVDTATDGIYFPTNLKDNTAGVDIAANYVEPIVCDAVEVVLAQADADNIVTVVLVVEQ